MRTFKFGFGIANCRFRLRFERVGSSEFAIQNALNAICCGSIYLSFLIGPVFCGCQSRRTVSLTARKPASIDAMTRNQRASLLTDSSAGELREPGSIKVYGINRYIDPADARIMHERHAIYRLEQQPTWISRSPKTGHEMILGPIMGLKKAEYAPEPLPGETSREIIQARRGVEQASASINAVRESQEKLASSVEALAKGTAEAERKLSSIVSMLNDRVRHLEAEGGNDREDRSQGSQMESSEPGVVVRPPN
jgi:hypothetical protein